MDWAQIIMAAIGGGIGAALGAALAHLLGLRNRASLIAVIFLVLGASLGGRLGPVLLGDTLGRELRSATGQTAQVEKELDALESQPIFAAIFKENPQAKEEIRQRLLDAFERGGMDGLLQESVVIGQTYGGSVLVRYVPRARPDDLMAFARAYVTVGDRLYPDHPALCHGWLGGSVLDVSRFSNVIGQENLSLFNETISNIIINAREEPFPIEQPATQEAVEEIMSVLLTTYPETILPLLRGEVPVQTLEQKAQICGFTIDLYKAIADHERGVSVLRLLLSG